jgi:hypothetical protein
MTPGQMTTSATCFFSAKQDDAVSMTWYQRALELFDEYRFAPILFTAAGGGFELDDCHLLADDGNGLYKWGDPEPILPRRLQLINALGTRDISHLSLDAPRDVGTDRQDWHIKVSVSSVFNDMFVALDEELIISPAALARRICCMASGLYEIRYGFAYKKPLADLPDCFAIGLRRFTFADFKELMRERREGIRREPSTDEVWRNELRENRRHLSGLFRDAYPVNILSESHVRAVNLLPQKIGTMSELDNALWLWELSEEGIPQAKAMLEDKKLLVSQAEHPS